jgi:outer membrane protein
MNRWLGLVLPLAVGIAMSSVAQDLKVPAGSSAKPVLAGGTRIVVVNFQTGVAKTNEGQRAYRELESKYAPREAQGKALDDEVKTLTTQLQTEGSKLTDAERASRAKAIEAKKKQSERFLADLKSDGNRDVQAMFNGLATKFGDFMVAYAAEHGYDVILDSSMERSPILYIDPSADITKEVILAYNVKSGVAAPAAQPAAAPKTQPATAPKAPSAR